jgi:hypothetical protein
MSVETSLRRAAAAGWPGVILSDTLAVRPTCDISNFTKSLAVAGAQIVPRNVIPAPEGVPADIAARTDLVGGALVRPCRADSFCSPQNKCLLSCKCKPARIWSLRWPSTVRRLQDSTLN